MLFNKQIKILMPFVMLLGVTTVYAMSPQIEVANCKDLENIDLMGDYIQIADIDCSDIANFDPIGDMFLPFTGTYDGNGFEITGLTIRNEYNTGLFGYIFDAVIENVNLVDVDVVGEVNVGGLVGLAEESIIRNCTVSGSVSAGESFAGGLMGYSLSNDVSYTDADVDVSGREFNTGGLIGGAYQSNISTSFANGAVVGDFAAGGLIGHLSSSTLLNSYAQGDVTGDEIVGGLIGLFDMSSIENTYSTGFIGGRDDDLKGGLIGAFLLSSSKDVIASYWDTDTSGQHRSAAGEGRTTEQMQLEDSSQPIYVDWDSTTIWSFEVGAYPTLQ